MKERPILFSAPMVRALLAGTKTQTRRVVKPQPPAGHNWAGWCAHSTHRPDEGKATWAAGTGPYMRDAHRVAFPYGQPGDRLWVREAWDFLPDSAGDEPNAAVIRYWAGGEWERRLVPDGFNPLLYGHERHRPSIHMPRWASRITLEVTDVRVERLHDISEADAIAEGIETNAAWPGGFYRNYMLPDDGDVRALPPRESYQTLWESINGPGSWEANPWVWAVSFKVVKP